MSYRNLTASSLIILLATITCLANPFAALKEQEVQHGFQTVAVYENGAGEPIGARFVSVKHGFLIDLFTLQTVPQGFIWVHSPADGDQGEPHTCEHLLLGKGNKGKYVAALEDMSLGTSSAYTSQIYTAYHFNTIANTETFYKLFEAKLDAMIHSDFTDEETRREVAHLGVKQDATSGKLVLEEKGTVYNEMVSNYEKPWSYTWGQLDKLIYGVGHPLSNVSGGEPSAIRKMTAQDMRNFVAKTYRLSQMGMITSLPDVSDVSPVLKRLSDVLDRLDSQPTPNVNAKLMMNSFAPAKPKVSNGEVVIGEFPSEKTDEPCEIIFSWPADLTCNLHDQILQLLFTRSFGGEAGSPLYDALVESSSRKLITGATAAYMSCELEQGHPFRVNVSGVEADRITKPVIDSVRTIVLNEIRALADAAPGSERLEKFRKRVMNLVSYYQRTSDEFLNSPPQFGSRGGPAGAWFSRLSLVEQDTGFRKSLVFKRHYQQLEQELAAGKNPWKELFTRWKLLEREPIAISAKPSPALLAKLQADTKQRLSDAVQRFEKKYGVNDEQTAIRKYQAEFDSNTVALERTYAKLDLPKFIDQPPMTVDDQLKWDTVRTKRGVPVFRATFENLSTSTMNLCFDVSQVDQATASLLPILPDIMTSLGATVDGKSISYQDMQQMLQREVLSWYVYFRHGNSGMVELVLHSSGSDSLENAALMKWMKAVLYTPNLSLENLPRIRDILEQSIQSMHDRMKGGEEGWVEDPADAYRFQSSPAYASTRNFLTAEFALKRLTWSLRDANEQAIARRIVTGLERGHTAKPSTSREEILALLENAAVLKDANPNSFITKLRNELKELAQQLPPDHCEEQWSAVLAIYRYESSINAAARLSSLQALLAQLTHPSGFSKRVVIVANSAHCSELERKVDEIFTRPTPVTPAAVIPALEKSFPSRPEVWLVKRSDGSAKPVYVGLMNENTRNGVLIFSSKNAAPYEATREKVLDALAGNLYSGGAGHGLFMRTWAAGLAYSNGYRFRDREGRSRYYAERCPDVSETMKFVSGVIANAPYDSTLGEYAVALAFERSRAGDRYEDRGFAMAADIADGVGSEKVAAYRKQALELRKMPGLTKELFKRMPQIYGEVLTGLGKPASAQADGCFFLIGPEQQMRSFEQHLQSVDETSKVFRLYPADFWLY